MEAGEFDSGKCMWSWETSSMTNALIIKYGSEWNQVTRKDWRTLLRIRFKCSTDDDVLSFETVWRTGVLTTWLSIQSSRGWSKTSLVRHFLWMTLRYIATCHNPSEHSIQPVWTNFLTDSKTCPSHDSSTVLITWPQGIFLVSQWSAESVPIGFISCGSFRFVLFYLARQYPQLVLCLHGGRFDHPDRMFNSVQQTWTNVYQGAADYKELVPEFYGSDGHFLVNYLGIDFGTRSDGRPIQDVELPPWAKTPQEFTSKLRWESDKILINFFVISYDSSP